ncbi:MAG: hypothetical protein IKJ01_09850 [Lachnospiraceae bacterium]|nr:hypothetical protein [Lachnospiraceae bacterium]
MYRLKDTINALYKIRKDMKNQKKAYILIGDYDAEGMAVEAFFDVSEIIKAIKGFLDLEIDKDYLIRCMKPIAMANKICIFFIYTSNRIRRRVGRNIK